MMFSAFPRKMRSPDKVKRNRCTVGGRYLCLPDGVRGTRYSEELHEYHLVPRGTRNVDPRFRLRLLFWRNCFAIGIGIGLVELGRSYSSTFYLPGSPADLRAQGAGWIPSIDRR
jgi:hypothetical protein